MHLHDPQQERWKQQAAESAAQLIEDEMVIGLGSGSTATFVAHALAQRIQAGLYLEEAVPTSRAMQHLAAALGIPLTTLDTPILYSISTWMGPTRLTHSYLLLPVEVVPFAAHPVRKRLESSGYSDHGGKEERKQPGRRGGMTSAAPIKNGGRRNEEALLSSGEHHRKAVVPHVE